jgi:phosphopantothenoylcysteine decarboxylase/phosphopantothenate--cysteine ligase
MNDRMYADAATQANLAALHERGVEVIDPDEGALASRGEHGAGRLPEPDRLLAEVERLAGAPAGPWDGLRVLVTAGGTREPIDAVRFVGNRSSGRMGFAVAEEALRRGAEVTVVAANVSLPRADGVRYVDVETAAELADATLAEFAGCDVLLMAAAVADFRPSHPEESKIEKAGRDGLELELEPTTDVLKALAPERRPGQTLVGFAAEHGDGHLDRARAKLERKGLDAVVVNDVSRPGIAFDSDENEVEIVTASGVHPVPRAAKEEIARAIIDAVEELRHTRARGVGAR